MSDPRLSYPQGGDASTSGARAERESRLQSDIDAMTAGPVQHAAEQTGHRQGAPSVQQQMTSHGAPAPSTPDVGGHDSAADPVC